MLKTLSMAFLLLMALGLGAQEIFYEHYGDKVDFWVVIPYSSLNFKKGQDKTEYQLSLQINNSKKKQIANFERTISVPKRDWLNDSGIPVQFSANLKEGVYGAQLQLKNKAMGDKRTYKRNFEIGAFSTEIGLSWIIASREGTEFIPSRLDNLQTDGLFLQQSYALALDSLRIWIDQQLLTVNNPASPITVDLKPYLSPETKNQLRLTFFEKNIHYNVEPFLFSPWYSYSLRYSIADQMAQLRYIATQNDWQVLRNLPKNKHQEAIEGFWNTHDPSPGTTRNETREQFYQRVLKADEKFTIHKKLQGWHSDRGRIYIKFGEPDDISADAFSANMKYPRIVWIYYKEDRQFYFADTQGYGQYILINKDEEY